MRLSQFLAACTMVVVSIGQLQAGLTLFAIQEQGQIAERLNYGTTAITESDSAYVYTGVGPQSHNSFFQRGVDGSGNTLFEIQWQFASTKTVSDRFQDAVSTGESVTWTVTSPSITGSQVFTGSWRFSNSAGDMTSRFNNTSSATYFSNDDGVWGAGNTFLNGNSSGTASNFRWGVANYNSSDSNGRLVLNGVISSVPSGFKNYMYLGDGSAVPEPTSFALFGTVCIAALRRRRGQRQTVA